MKVKTVSHRSGDSLPILLDRDGFPIPSPNEFLLSRRNLSTNTLIRNLRELSVLYRWLDDRQIDLRKRLKSGTLFTEAEFSGGLIEFLRKDMEVEGKVVAPHTFNNRLATIRQYFVWEIDVYLSSLPLSSSQYELLQAARKRLMRWIDRAFLNLPKAGSLSRKSLTNDEAEFLLWCLNPENPNSFAFFEPVKFRNFVVASLMLNCGLRPGELLSLRVEDIQIGAISSVTVKRRPPDPFDKRKPRPSVKRNGRTIPVEGNSFVRMLDLYIVEWREILEQKSSRATEYLILSDEGEPLSHSSLTQLFSRLRREYPDSLPKNLTPKSLRHTFSSRMEQILRKAGLEEDRRKQALAMLRGDSSLESQSEYIAQEIEEQARQALSDYQKKLITGLNK
ncbi:tyrosine-type recombinase/integrase [Neisseria animaloris]|uniref:tyrosine-type recombinase/integrase n=1 Tax=Neisseria animaloris TaxID=326522 RepID=UPI0039DF45A3